jgi:hypothetical protein
MRYVIESTGEAILEVKHMYDLQANETYDVLKVVSAVVLGPEGIPVAIEIPSPECVHVVQ